MENPIELPGDRKGCAPRKMRVLVAARRNNTAHLIWDQSTQSLCGEINVNDLVAGVVYQPVCAACLDELGANKEGQ